ncbi:hypothetical protein V6M85_06295 [Sulfolobus tengchongensis]|uniref:Uncharacterized protein n=1 Tax=Sulfolobus tengchongensis TaxID=207809 RepID=A0AAX4L3W7_9CREN
MKLLPFYDVNGIFIDAYFLDKISKPYLRILLVRSDVSPIESNGNGLQPIPLPKVIELLKEGYESLKQLKEKERLDTTDYLLSILYNSGYYFKKREKEITLSSLARIYGLAYKMVLEKLQTTFPNVNLRFVRISVFDNKIMINDKEDPTYTNLFNSDTNFKKAILDSLSEL